MSLHKEVRVSQAAWLEKVWNKTGARRGFIGELKDFLSGPELVWKPVKMDEGWEDVLPGLPACEDCRGLGWLEPVQDSVAGVLTG